MQVPLTGVSNEQIVIIQVSGVNGVCAPKDVQFGFLIADTDASCHVGYYDKNWINTQVGQPVSSTNFRDDVNHDGRINSIDVREVKFHLRQSIP